jgi:hypothetical protein
MKKFICLVATSAAVVALFTPKSVLAQTVFVQSVSSNGNASNTIYLPSKKATTITTIERVTSNLYQNNNPITTSTTTTYSDGAYPGYHRHQYGQSTIILQQQNIYPRAVRAACSTSIMGSPIPSPIALNVSTGQICN